MRIVYDDSMQSQLTREIRNFVVQLDLQEINKVSWDYDKKRLTLCDLLRAFLRTKHFEVGKIVKTTRYDLDYPVFYHPENSAEIQLCGYLCIRRLPPQPQVVLRVLDYNLDLVSPEFKFHEDNVEEVEYERI